MSTFFLTSRAVSIPQKVNCDSYPPTRYWSLFVCLYVFLKEKIFFFSIFSRFGREAEGYLIGGRKVAHVVLGVSENEHIIKSHSGSIGFDHEPEFVQGFSRHRRKDVVLSVDIEIDGAEPWVLLDPGLVEMEVEVAVKNPADGAYVELSSARAVGDPSEGQVHVRLSEGGDDRRGADREAGRDKLQRLPRGSDGLGNLVRSEEVGHGRARSRSRVNISGIGIDYICMYWFV